jgi:hypothetical protein
MRWRGVIRLVAVVLKEVRMRGGCGLRGARRKRRPMRKAEEEGCEGECMGEEWSEEGVVGEQEVGNRG